LGSSLFPKQFHGLASKLVVSAYSEINTLVGYYKTAGPRIGTILIFLGALLGNSESVQVRRQSVKKVCSKRCRTYIFKVSKLNSRHQPAIAGYLCKGGVMRSKLLRRKAASEYLNQNHGVQRATSTLAKLAVVGGGPVFRRDGRVPLYSTDDLDLWAASLLSQPMRTTSDLRDKMHAEIEVPLTQEKGGSDALGG
jgi:hypothetical protein